MGKGKQVVSCRVGKIDGLMTVEELLGSDQDENARGFRDSYHVHVSLKVPNGCVCIDRMGDLQWILDDLFVSASGAAIQLHMEPGDADSHATARVIECLHGLQAQLVPKAH